MDDETGKKILLKEATSVREYHVPAGICKPVLFPVLGARAETWALKANGELNAKYPNVIEAQILFDFFKKEKYNNFQTSSRLA